MNGAHIAFPIHSFGIEYLYAVCDMEFDLRINSKGLGYVVHQEMTPNALYAPGSCERRPCHYPNAPNPSFVPPATRNGNHNEGRPWRAYAREVGGVGRLTILFCLELRSSTSLEPPTDKRHMEVTIPFTETANHRYRFTAPLNDDACTTPDQLCEIEGEFTTEATQLQGPGATETTRRHVEINHVP